MAILPRQLSSTCRGSAVPSPYASVWKGRPISSMGVGYQAEIPPLLDPLPDPSLPAVAVALVVALLLLFLLVPPLVRCSVAGPVVAWPGIPFLVPVRDAVVLYLVPAPDGPPLLVFPVC